MRFELLGPLTVTGGADEAVGVAGKRLRVLLAALLLRANTPVSWEALAEAVWDGTPPLGAARTLRSHVTRLRRALGAQIVACGPGYLIRVQPGELDVLQFEALCRESGEALRAGSWGEASQVAARALVLWHGEPLLDIPSQALRDRFVPRLEQLRLQVLEDHAEAELRLGRHERLVPQLRELARAYPLRERLHAQLMLALERAGRRAEALEAYQDARRVLVEQLGIEPGTELRELHGRILAADDARPTVKPSADPALRTAAEPPRQLPAAAACFIGRSSESQWLSALVESGRVAGATVVVSAIDGMAGIGKTALTVHAAHRVAARFPDGQLFLDLHGYTQGHPPRTASEALEWLLRALGVPGPAIPADSEARAALYRQRLAGTRTLIVLDNAASEAQVRPLLPGAPGCLVLITSRRRLKGLDDARSLSLGLLEPRDAAALLRAVAGPERIAADDPLLDEIAHLCGYLPLALRIAGALSRHRPTWSLEHLAGLLRDRHGRVPALSDGERDLGAVFDLSYTGLPDAHRRLLRRLGLVPGPDTDAYAAAALLEVDPRTAAGLLEGLVDHNLLFAHAPGRYRLHDLMRAHARAVAGTDPEPDRAAALDRLLHYYAYTAQRASTALARYPRPAPGGPAPDHRPALPGAENARAWLRTERDNLEDAVTHARTLALDEHVIALSAGLAEIVLGDGPLARALDLHRDATQSAGRAGRPDACAAALSDQARAQYLSGDLPGADAAASRAVAIFRQIGDGHGEANGLVELGIARYLLGDLRGADDAASRALVLYQEIGDRRGEAYALDELGRVRQLVGDLPTSEEFLARALTIFREIGDRRGEADALANLGLSRLLTGELPGAEDAASKALKIFEEIGDRRGEAYALVQLGRVRRATGDLPGADDALVRSLEISRATGNRNDEAWALGHYAAIVAAGGDQPRAVALYGQALAMDSEMNKRTTQAYVLEGLGDCHLYVGEVDDAAAHLTQAWEIYQDLGMNRDAERVDDRLRALTHDDHGVAGRIVSHPCSTTASRMTEPLAGVAPSAAFVDDPTGRDVGHEDIAALLARVRVNGARATRARRGKRSGPTPKLTPAQRQALAALMADEERTVTAGEVAAGFGISRATLYRELARAKTTGP